MTLPENAFPKGNIGYGMNYQIISRISIRENHLIDNYFQQDGKLLNWVISNRRDTPIEVNPNDCEWLSQTFFRNEKTLYGFSLIEKSNSTKMFLTPIKGKVDFDTFEPLGKNYAKDKHRYYYGPGGKIIKENHLELFFDNTYRQEWLKLHPSEKSKQILSLWNSKIATSDEKVYWKGKLVKGVHSSLKRITPFFFADNYNVYAYDLQTIKKIEGVDIDSLVFCNIIKNNSIHGIVSDKFKPISKYLSKEDSLDKYDFKHNAPLFESKREELSSEYWWYELEKTIYNKS
ncbi:DKNYY family protein [Aquimarina sp. MAR_2010_214]|uniref:DKNYY domain-containing protein n=1 Tax=Aquimarina sp. MAR_2010_214 TaxID=1250026 RepID=UPI000C6FDD42|nr:DKNYY domain-containing protein [Aquimarina sp. MAR_2010_214]PKV50905.1 DKNYY family protein [Aquimarina sp. MAR_2010_214]